MKGYKVMYDYRGKVAGMIGAGIGIALLILEKLTHFILFPKLNAEQHYNVFLWATLAFLFCIGYSTEKYEDERAKQIRAKAVMIAFMIEAAAMLAFGLTLSTSAYSPKTEYPMVANAAEQVEFGRLLMFMPGVAIVIFLLYFHIGLYRDDLWDYSDTGSLGFVENLKKNYLNIIVISIAGILLVMMLATVFM